MRVKKRGVTWAIIPATIVLLGCSDSGANEFEPPPRMKLLESVGDTLRAAEGQVAVAVPLFVVGDGYGGYYVADVSDKDIKAFAPGGALTRRIGRAGEGPGEFRSLAGVMTVGRDVAGFERFGATVSLFDSAGSYQGAVTVRDKEDKPLTAVASLRGMDDSLFLAAHWVDPSARALVSLHDRAGEQLREMFSPSYLKRAPPGLVQNTWVIADGEDDLIWVLLLGARQVSVFDLSGTQLATGVIRPSGDTTSLKTLIERNDRRLETSDSGTVMDSFESAMDIIALGNRMALVQFATRTDGGVDRLAAGGTLVLLTIGVGRDGMSIQEVDRRASSSSLIGKRDASTALLMRWLGAEYEGVELSNLAVADGP